MTEFLQKLLLAVITAAVPVITYYLLTLLKPAKEYFKKLMEKLHIDQENQVIKNTLDNIFDTIYTVVVSTSQTYVNTLKAEGKFDEEAQRKAFIDTKTKILALLDEEAKQLITDLYVDLDLWLDAKIESIVYATKSNKVGE